MKICMIAEGCYPYVKGGVSSWIQSIINSFPDVEFVVLAIVSNRDVSGKFEIKLPPNVTAVYEAYLNDFDWDRTKKMKQNKRLSQEYFNALRSIVLDEEVNWDVVFELFQKEHLSVDQLLMGPDFLEIVRACYKKNFSQITFSDFLWTMRSIYLPLFLILKTELPEADIYHCVSTGYSGVLGAMANHFYPSALLISEHGIYTREREEELIKASWVQGIYKNIWIDQFRKMSRIAYDKADRITSLFAHARDLQIGLGANPEKLVITPNGIKVENFENVPGKKPEDEGFVNVGAVLRVTPIKDVKTMIRAFSFAKAKEPSLKLWIMGTTQEDQKYAQECFDLVEALRVPDVVFTGTIQTTEYIGRMDFTILTSISEGMPLTILEGFAAHKPAIATDVGNCRELIFGNQDNCGTAGILCHIMNAEELAAAMVEMARNPEKRMEMGENGYNRVTSYFRVEQMKKTYAELYEQIGREHGKTWGY